MTTKPKRRNNGPATPTPRRRTPTNETRPDALRARVRAGQALALRIEGGSFRDIAMALDVDASTACRDVRRVLDEINAGNQESAEVMRALEGERLDALSAALWPAATSGDTRAVLAMLRIMERRAKLFGLDAPVKVAATSPDGLEGTEMIITLPANWGQNDLQ